MRKLMYVTTDGMTLNWLMKGHLAYMTGEGFDVVGVTSPGHHADEIEVREGVRVVRVAMEREIAPLKDLSTVFELVKIMRSERPDIVSAGTPKAALLALMAARVTAVPVRVYLLLGLRLETLRGFRRAIAWIAERVAVAAATDIISVSTSLRVKFLESRLSRASKVAVLGAGSLNGVDSIRFALDPDVRKQLRLDLKLSDEAVVIGFVGRLVRDKGIEELITAFDAVRLSFQEAVLVLVGEYEEADSLRGSFKSSIQTDPSIIQTGFVSDASPYYSVMDVFAFPSYREGLPNAPLEAASAGLPTVAYRCTGNVDVVADGETGLLVEVGDVSGLTKGLEKYLAKPKLRARHGAEARARAVSRFSQQAVWAEFTEFYRTSAKGHC